jgi:hypothetical protein
MTKKVQVFLSKGLHRLKTIYNIPLSLGRRLQQAIRKVKLEKSLTLKNAGSTMESLLEQK